MFLSKCESRSLIAATICIDVISAFSDFCFVLRWNIAIGISDIVWLFFGSQALQSLKLSLTMLVPFVLISKITPAHVEATIFSFSASIISMQLGLGTITGSLWNSYFFHVDTEHMENLYKLILLQMALGLVCLLYVPLIPSWDAITKVQVHLRRLNSDQVVDLRKIEENQE